MFKHALLNFYDSYNSIMDHNTNPLRNIPDPMARFWIMTVLAWMWSVTFGLYIGSIFIAGLSMVAHIAVLLMVFATVGVFYDAEKNNSMWLKKLKKERRSKKTIKIKL